MINKIAPLDSLEYTVINPIVKQIVFNLNKKIIQSKDFYYTNKTMLEHSNFDMGEHVYNNKLGENYIDVNYTCTPKDTFLPGTSEFRYYGRELVLDKVSGFTIRPIYIGHDLTITLKYSSVLGSLGHGLINYELEPVSIVLDKYLLDFIEGSYYDTEVITGYGDSMEPFIQDGSLIFIDKTKTNLINNKIYAFLIEDRLYIKQFKKDKNMFISFNKSYPAVENNRCKIIGKVVGVLTKF